MEIKTKADLKRIPVGTKLRMTHNLLGPCNKVRTIKQVRSKDIILTMEDGRDTYLTLGGKFESLPNGFQLIEELNNGPVVAVRYEFIEE